MMIPRQKEVCNGEWLKIQPDLYQKLAGGYRKHLTELKMDKRNFTRY